MTQTDFFTQKVSTFKVFIEGEERRVRRIVYIDGYFRWTDADYNKLDAATSEFLEEQYQQFINQVTQL